MEHEIFDENRSSSIIGDIQLPICDVSTRRKREGDSIRKEKKKRRSSLSCHRRSITGDIELKLPLDANFDSQSSSESGSQKSPSSDITDQRLLPNPANIKLDAAIAIIESEISRLNNESKQWAKLLTNLDERENQAQLLSNNLTLPVDDIPTELQELGRTEYIKCKPINVLNAKEKVDSLVLQYQFDRESCISDVKLIKEALKTMQIVNKGNTFQPFQTDIQENVIILQNS
ncbi:unnamed protein product [Lymnaea stagnalis]|uniref:Uncharacterized protein n=1 Tax=Lymnaea stagnalis TaxID=6523 RepID=A0AAV2GZX0_LYMST